MSNKKTQKINNNSFVTVEQFNNFKKEIKNEINKININNENIHSKLDSIHNTFKDLQNNDDDKFELVLKEIRNINNKEPIKKSLIDVSNDEQS